MSRKPLLYLDTMIFLDLLRQRSGYEDSVSLIQEVRRRTYRALTSTYTILEIQSKEQEEVFWRRQIIDFRRTVDEIRRSRMSLNRAALENLQERMDSEIWGTLIESGSIDLYDPDKWVWDDALRLMHELVISPSDALHVATAIRHESDLFVTKDQQLLDNMGEFVDASKPKEVRGKLKEMGS